jgi:hypothetical protein
VFDTLTPSFTIQKSPVCTAGRQNKEMAVSGAVVKKKDIQLYNHYVKSKGVEKGSFCASTRSKNFKNWMTLHDIKRIGKSAAYALSTAR